MMMQRRIPLRMILNADSRTGPSLRPSAAEMGTEFETYRAQWNQKATAAPLDVVTDRQSDSTSVRRLKTGNVARIHRQVAIVRTTSSPSGFRPGLPLREHRHAAPSWCATAGGEGYLPLRGKAITEPIFGLMKQARTPL